ncbi:hydroxyethylthiazole kinase [Domibacillus epiphyticus]|uniref:Hydroxyethylthiazole kinase n=1 Tax=Domibacillus epiphyticus TaxID=1714355 RepID=A0A1V2A5A6_9BACI|nr:hydroxyethylthiazole kinase [Domibacillus epiphyticus]OMP66185.1 hydroxyethylthiazole kinase [Domibacillus epiphyticus]
MNNEFAAELLERVRITKPLVHNLTNTVVTNFTANGLLALGASPVMADAVEEAEDMVKIAGAVLLNIGTLTAPTVEAMILAGKAANKAGVPVIFDPVGAGATPFRTESAKRILSEVQVDVLRGNAGEIAVLCGQSIQVKGVDGGGNADVRTLAKEAGEILGVTCVITGAEDVVYGEESLSIQNGDPILTTVTGTGCLLGSVIAAFCAVEKNYALAAAAALAFYGTAAERAAHKSGSNRPGTFAVEFLNELALTGKNEVRQNARIEVLER